MNRWLLFVITALSLIACAGEQNSNAPAGGVFYFEETGHRVQGEFLDFYIRYRGPSSLGCPLTEEITIDGWQVQYFEKGRLEYHPENEPAYRVTVGWLGDLLHRRRPPLPTAQIPAADDANRRYFPKTGHTLSGDFLHYFEANGGTVRFGQPISEPFLWEGRLTQDFQSARFFWTPEKEIPVTLEEIGRVHFQSAGLHEKFLEPAGD